MHACTRTCVYTHTRINNYAAYRTVGVVHRDESKTCSRKNEHETSWKQWGVSSWWQPRLDFRALEYWKGKIYAPSISRKTYSWLQIIRSCFILPMYLTVISYAYGDVIGLIYVNTLEQVNPFTNICQVTFFLSFGQNLLSGIIEIYALLLIVTCSPCYTFQTFLPFIK